MFKLNTTLARLIICNNNNNKQTVITRNVKRWVAPTLITLKRRKEMVRHLEVAQPRSKFIEWNYQSELYAVGKRLNEQFNSELLQQAFITRSYIIQEEQKQQAVGIDTPETNLNDNKALIEKGSQLIDKYVRIFLQSQLPNGHHRKLPIECINSIHDYLVNDEMLSHIAKNLGFSDLILTNEYPPEQITLANTFKAIVGALAHSNDNNNNNNEITFNFIRDFICVQLNQKDINEIWELYNPMAMLQELCKSNEWHPPEPRIINEVGRNTILVTYHIGIYSNKQFLGSGFGENINNAIDVAARNCLAKLYEIDNLRPFNYKITLNECLPGAVSHTTQIKG